MAALLKETCQSLLKQAGVYERVKASWLYTAYWSIADRQLIEQPRREFAFYKRTLIGLSKNDLVFDIGANCGTKTDMFLKLGARVIAVDPDISNQKTLSDRFVSFRLQKKPLVIVGKAVSDRSGYETLWVSKPGFEMNTLNPKWAESLATHPARFGRTYEFGEKRQVETITLEQLIATYGRPFYIKIDVEGYEANVLKGLQTPVAYLSFEVNLPEFKIEGDQCIDRLREIAPDGVFNYSVGNRLILLDWLPHDPFVKVFRELTHSSVEVFWRTYPAANTDCAVE